MEPNARRREFFGRCLSSLRARSSLLLLLVAAALPFLPGFLQFLRRGVPDVLFTGDAATLEMRVLHAAHGTQLLGAYSRFKWSHPGPSFFYLALPIYEAFHRHGPALNLFVFLLNIGCAIGVGLVTRRLRGTAFAAVALTLLAVYECVAAPFQLSSEWNPIVPILPLGLLSLLCACLGSGFVPMLPLLPLFVLLGSLIVQTHLGFLPIVVLLAGLAAAFALSARLRPSAARQDEESDLPVAPARPTWMERTVLGRASRTGWWLLAGLVLVVTWLPPLYENATREPGNLTLLYRFFAARHVAEHPWPVVMETVARELARLPLGLAEAVGLYFQPRPSLVFVLSVGETVALVAMLARAAWQGDRLLTLLASIPLGQIIVSLLCVRAIRGDIHPYLVAWVSVVGLTALFALTAWCLPTTPRRAAGRGGVTVSALVVIVMFALCLRLQFRTVDVFKAPDETAERLARDIQRYLDATPMAPPQITLGRNDTWPTAAAVVVYLYKRGVAFSVERDWLFMMGSQFASPSRPDSRQEPPHLLIADGTFCQMASGRRDLQFVAKAGAFCAFVGDPAYWQTHQAGARVKLLAAKAVRGDPSRAVDGVVPAEATPWDSPLSVVLLSTESTIQVAVPDTAVDGLFLSVDGNDTYAVTCLTAVGKPKPLGTVSSNVPFGMGTGLLFSEELSSCRAISIQPEHGDGYYSLGEVGFLRK